MLIGFSFQLPYEFLTPLQAAVGVVQKVQLHSIKFSCSLCYLNWNLILLSRLVVKCSSGFFLKRWKMAFSFHPFVSMCAVVIIQFKYLWCNRRCMFFQGLRPTIPKHTNPKLAELLERCWQQDPSSRPDFSEIIEILLQIAKEVSSPWLASFYFYFLQFYFG